MADFSWAEFIRAVTSAFAAGTPQASINAAYGGSLIEGQGEVTEIDLGDPSDEHRSPVVKLRLPPVRFEVPPDGYGSVSYLALHTEPDAVALWAPIRAGDTVRFTTRIVPDGPLSAFFPPIQVTRLSDTSGKHTVMLSTEGSRLVERVERARQPALSMTLYGLLPTPRDSGDGWYVDDRPLTQAQRDALRAVLTELGLEAPYEGTLEVSASCTLDLSFMGLDRDACFVGGHGRLRGHDPKASVILWRLLDAGGVVMDVSGLAKATADAAQLDALNRVAPTVFAEDPDALDAMLWEGLDRARRG